MTPIFSPAAPRASRAASRCPPTRCISAPGAAARAAASSATTSSPRRWCRMPPISASPTWSCCRSPSIRSMRPGATSRSACSPRRAGSAIRPASPASSIAPIRPGLASSSTGSRRISRPTCTASPTSTASRCTSIADPRRGFQTEWNTAIYDFGRREVANVLIASALYWLDRFHIDALRVDAVASMLYLDYSRRPGEWLPNPDGVQRQPRRRRLPAPLQRAGLRRPSRRDHHRRGVHRLGRRVAADRCRRPRLRLQVEHGLDARHAGLHGARSGAPALAPRPHDVRPAVRVDGEFRAAAVA